MSEAEVAVTLTYATRKSALALAQARAFMAELGRRRPELQFTELHVVTTGDRVQDRSLSTIGGKGLFVKEIEEALLERRADVAIHSLKDVPPELAPGLRLGCFPEREDPRDVLVSKDGSKLAELPRGSRVGTSSLRRRVQLLGARPDLQIVELRGNVDTRLRKCREGELDAIVIARAGLIRLGRADEATEILDPGVMLPAVGQGALVVELRADDQATAERLEVVAHLDTKIAVTAERGVMSAVSGNCQTPVAAFGVREGGELWLRGMLAEPDGSRPRHRETRVGWPTSEEEAFAAGLALGKALLAG